MATSQASGSNVGAGQQYPDDSNSDFSVVSFIIKQFLAELETNTPVQVKAVHPGSGSPPALGTVDVQLLVSILDGNGNATKQGEVFGIPYFRFQFGPWAIVADPAAGDYGFIVGMSRDSTNAFKTPGIVNPGSFRKFSFSDGIFIPCPFAQAAPAATFWLKGDGTFVLTDKPGLVLQSDGSGGLKVTGNVAVTGNITATGSVQAGFGGGDQVGLQTHTHGGVQTGSGTSGPPTAGT